MRRMLNTRRRKLRSVVGFPSPPAHADTLRPENTHPTEEGLTAEDESLGDGESLAEPPADNAPDVPREELEPVLAPAETDGEVEVDRTLRAILLMGKDHRIQGYNQRAADLLAGGRGQGLRVGDAIQGLLDSDTQDSFGPNFRAALDGGSVRHDRLMRGADGADHWFEAQYDPVWGETGEIVGVCMSLWPIDDRKSSEAALARLAALVESSEDAISSETLDGLVVSWNPGAERLFCYAAHEIEGQASSMLVPSDRQGELLGVLAQLRRGDRIEPFETVRLRKDGQRVDVSLAISPIRASSGTVIGASTIARDIGARKRAEEQLREREHQYRSIFEATSDGLIIQDLHTGVVVGANPAACRMHGYPCEEFIGQPPSAWVHPADHYLIDEYARSVRAGGQFRGRRLHVRKDGSPLHVEVLGTAFTYLGKPHILCVIRDVTEQVRAREMLEQRVEERTRELSTLLALSSSVASTLELKPLLGVILDQLKETVGYDTASICSLKDDELSILDYRGSLPRQQVIQLRWPLPATTIVSDVVKRREPVLIFDVQDNSSVGRQLSSVERDYMWRIVGDSASWMGVPLIVKEQVIGVVSVAHRDVNHYHPRHARLALTIANQAAVAIENARLYEQAQAVAAVEERQRLARELHDSVSQALYGIVLGVRTARTYLEREPSRAAEPLEYVLSLAEAALAEMRTLIFELRPESLATEGLIAALTKRAASVSSRHGVALKPDLGEEPPVSIEIKEALYRIAQEAMYNTVKHARATTIGLRLTYELGEITLEVTDDGVGFDPTVPFAGHLGLRSMRERAARLDGTLVIESVPGKGTHLTARIPAWSESR